MGDLIGDLADLALSVVATSDTTSTSCRGRIPDDLWNVWRNRNK